MTAYDTPTIFERTLRGELPAHKVYEDAHTLAFLHFAPRSPGHTVIIPKVRSRNLFDVGREELAQVMRSAQTIAKAAMTALGADGVILHQVNEEAADQTVFYFHVHIIPCYEGIEVKPPRGPMEKPEILAIPAAKLWNALMGPKD
ncbi:HIT-like protein [Variibacter gotjawalensis]|uniref:HIT-like protein n=1 Tax=Variibacter gotjawalensis TaxID=1333996 RepID=A0A0S3PY03_9BRAD|nr:HIT domain-containing protein [Variibacter gotjawalensis]NIK46634.1 histidine triad (HIT) family protein [Variibacter gotjawalensis]RZS48537.1 histidine triad (HIT) family protein [Variibacter gotjawalensis]BAT60799.1 HIT-like protein [Variibacter gotjawalensis]